MELQEKAVAGIFPGMSNEAYHAYRDAIGSSGVREALYTLLSYKRKYVDEQPKEEGEKPASWQILGDGLHTLVLEPTRFAKTYVKPLFKEDLPGCLTTVADIQGWMVDMGVGYTSKDTKPKLLQLIKDHCKVNPNIQPPVVWEEAQAKFEADNAGKIIISPKDWDAIHEGAKEIKNTLIARGILSQGAPEVSFFAVCPMTGLMQKSRPDWLVDNGDETFDMADLKSTSKGRKLKVDAWKREVFSHGYHVQSAHHGDVIEQAYAAAGTPKKVVNRLHIVYSFEDKLCRVFRLSENQINIGRARCTEAKMAISNAFKINSFPGFPDEIADLPDNTWDGTEIE